MSALYEATDWAMTAEAKELRDILVSLGLDFDLATATLERLLPEDVVYNFEDSEEPRHG